MTNNVTDALQHLATTFTVRDIMTPKARLMCADGAERAPGVSAANPDYSVIPIQKDGKLTAYFERDSGQATAIGVGDLVSDGTTILHMVDILQGRDFSFVLTSQRIEGYVHYSDLNHQMVKWTFYVMPEAVERLALESLQPVNERGYLREKLGPDRYIQIEGMYKRAGDNGRNLMTYLNLADILKLAVSEDAFQLDEDSIKMMKSVRDWAAHVLYDLPPEKAVRSLATVKRECERLLGSTERAESMGPQPRSESASFSNARPGF